MLLYIIFATQFLNNFMLLLRFLTKKSKINNYSFFRFRHKKYGNKCDNFFLLSLLSLEKIQHAANFMNLEKTYLTIYG